MTDTFNGDNAALVKSTIALLELDAKNALAPHGIGGHARTLLEAFVARTATQPTATTTEVTEAMVDAYKHAYAAKMYEIMNTAHAGPFPIDVSDLAIRSGLAAALSTAPSGDGGTVQLREAYEAAQYVPGDCPVVPVKIDAFMKAVGAMLSAATAGEAQK